MTNVELDYLLDPALTEREFDRRRHELYPTPASLIDEAVNHAKWNGKVPNARVMKEKRERQLIDADEEAGRP